jgi:oxygen-dependent protoporphyrinogen oxidase
MKSVAIIGGGITGLTCAFRLKQRGVSVTLYEAAGRTGGVIRSVREGGFLAECGPNTMLETSPKILDLIQDLGLQRRRLYSQPSAENRYIVRGGRPVPMPGSLPGFIGSPLFSTTSKLRLLLEPFIPPAAPDAEESVGQFVLRRLGRDFLNYGINPMVGGVYAGDPARLSVRHAFPRLHALEQRYRSLIAGQVLGAKERKRRREVSKQSAPKFSFDEGLQVLTDELKNRLGADLHLGAAVSEIESFESGWRIHYRAGGEDLLAEHGAVLFAGTAHQLARVKITAAGAPSLAPMAEVYHPPVTSVALGFRREDVSHPLDGFGMLVPEVEGFNILGTLFSSSLFPGRAPRSHGLLTSYIGGARNPELAALDPAEQADLVLRDVRKLLGVSGTPAFIHIYGHAKAIPQYNVGFGRYKELMSALEAKCPGIFLAGHYREGISLGDSMVSGHEAASRIASYLQSTKPEDFRGCQEMAILT